MDKECLTIKVSEVEENRDVLSLSQYLSSQQRLKKIGAYSFLLADNRDMSRNDFARDLRVAFDCPPDKLEDITEQVKRGGVF